MTTTQQPPPVPPAILWQPEKHLRSGDRIWILTDLQSYDSRYLAWSEEQELFRVGIFDLETRHVGLANFGRDPAFAMMKADVPPPPWLAPMPFGLALRRDAHDVDPRGRYISTVERLPIEPELHAILVPAMQMIARTAHNPNSTPGMWDDLVARAATESAIEQVALRKTVPFSAGDIKIAIGDPEANVTPVLQRMVREGKLLPPTGKKRGTRYRKAP